MEVIGEFSFIDNGFTINCSADIVMSRLNSAACDVGADAYQLTWTKNPSWSGSTCFQAKALFLKYKESDTESSR